MEPATGRDNVKRERRGFLEVDAGERRKDTLKERHRNRYTTTVEAENWRSHREGLLEASAGTCYEPNQAGRIEGECITVKETPFAKG